MAPFHKLKPVEEPVLKPKNGIVQPPVMPPSYPRCRRTNVLDSLRKVMAKIWKRSWAFHFHKPVDSREQGMANYHELIKRPMDLGTIKLRLVNRYYRQSDEAIEDFRLVFENCLKFHKRGTPLYNSGQYLKHFFNKSLAKIDLTKEMVVRRKSRKQKPASGKKPSPPPTKPFPGIKFRGDPPWRNVGWVTYTPVQANRNNPNNQRYIKQA